MHETINLLTILPLRLYVGWVFLSEALHKLSGGFYQQEKLRPILEGWIKEGKVYGFFLPFLRDYLVPHPKLITVVVVAGELLVGSALLAGLFTRPAAFLGLVMSTLFLLAKGDTAGANSSSAFMAMTFTLLLTHPGRTLGLDAALQGKVPRWLS